MRFKSIINAMPEGLYLREVSFKAKGRTVGIGFDICSEESGHIVLSAEPRWYRRSGKEWLVTVHGETNVKASGFKAASRTFSSLRLIAALVAVLVPERTGWRAWPHDTAEAQILADEEAANL